MNEIEEVEHRFDSIERSTSPNDKFSRDSVDKSRGHGVPHYSRERPQRQIKRKESPNAPNVKQYWYCGGHLFLPYGLQFTCLDLSDGYWKACVSYNVGNGNYVCYDHTNGKYEWPNWNEIDYTPDNSHLTSLGTDGILYTSPSINVMAND